MSDASRDPRNALIFPVYTAAGCLPAISRYQRQQSHLLAAQAAFVRMGTHNCSHRPEVAFDISTCLELKSSNDKQRKGKTPKRTAAFSAVRWALIQKVKDCRSLYGFCIAEARTATERYRDPVLLKPHSLWNTLYHRRTEENEQFRKPSPGQAGRFTITYRARCSKAARHTGGGSARFRV